MSVSLIRGGLMCTTFQGQVSLFCLPSFDPKLKPKYMRRLFSHHLDTVPNTHNLKEERFILVHVFSPELSGCKAWKAWWEVWQRSAHITAAWKQRFQGKAGKGGEPSRSRPQSPPLLSRPHLLTASQTP